MNYAPEDKMDAWNLCLGAILIAVLSLRRIKKHLNGILSSLLNVGVLVVRGGMLINTRSTTTGNVQYTMIQERDISHLCPMPGLMGLATPQNSSMVHKTVESGGKSTVIFTDCGQAVPQKCMLVHLPLEYYLLTSYRVISDPVHLKEIFFDSDRHSKATNNNSGYLMSQILGKCVGLLSPPESKAVRMKLEHPFTHRAIESSSSRILQVTELYFEEAFRRKTLNEGDLDPMKDFEFYPFLITATLIYGELGEVHILKLKMIMPIRVELFGYVFKGGLSRFSLAKYLPTHFNRLLHTFQSLWKEFNSTIYLEKKSQGESSPIVSFYDQMIAGDLPEAQVGDWFPLLH